MTIAMVLGCSLLTMSPSLAFLTFFVRDSPIRVVVMIVAAFFWVLSTSVAGVWWMIIPPLRLTFPVTVGCTVLFGEIGRYAYYALFTKSWRILERMMQKQSRMLDTLAAAAASGVGYGIIYTLTGYISTLTEGTGPGTLPSPHCPAVSLFVVSGLHALAFNVLEVLFMVVAFYGYRRNKGFAFLVIVLHFCAAYFTLLGCLASVFAIYVLTLGTVFLTGYVLLAAYGDDRKAARAARAAARAAVRNDSQAPGTATQ